MASTSAGVSPVSAAVPAAAASASSVTATCWTSASRTGGVSRPAAPAATCASCASIWSARHRTVCWWPSGSVRPRPARPTTSACLPAQRSSVELEAPTVSGSGPGPGGAGRAVPRTSSGPRCPV
ncbi:hypothetical protein V2I01_03015 [Micromonospora sp. BRA006-A]|nr:hypothetical protein [Micromonospora sp. BRA006-A]